LRDTGKALTILKHCFIKADKPTKVVIMATDRCNSRCSTCNIWSQKEHISNIITPEEISIALSDPICSDIDSVLITGGEPTLREDLYAFVMAIHKALPNAHIALSTNGIRPYTMLILVNNLLHEGVTNISVGTSIDYIGEKHDQIRGVPGNWRKVNLLIDGLIKLREQFPTLGIGFGTVLQGENADNIEEIVKFAKERDLYYLLQWCNQSLFYRNYGFSKLNPDKEKELVMKYHQDGLLKERWIKKLWGNDIRFNCYALRDFFVIAADGEIKPCLTHWFSNAGNIREKPISEILNNPRVMVDVWRCSGCINSWGTLWSHQANGWDYASYYFRHPDEIWEKLK
jgi:MoaA/NifB/PqqE/SkfB family radical SAM enzyme